ncbi:MAG: diguanylate cyclase, partial [Pseudomonadota bacterium]
VLRGVVAHDSYSVALRRRGDWPRQTSENAVGHGEPSPLVSAKDHLPELPPSEWADDLNVMFSQSRFMSLGDAEFNRCVRHDHCLALLIVRVDGLKHLSRQIGAASADKVLTALTTRWRGAIRDHDLIGRLGVETFGILLPETDTERAAAVAARLRDAMAKESASGSHPKTDLELEVGVSSLSSNHHCFDDIYSDAEMVLTNSLKSKQFNQSSVVA